MLLESQSGPVRARPFLEAAEIAEVGDPKHLRFKGLDATSAYLRDFTYAYGRIELGPIRR